MIAIGTSDLQPAASPSPHYAGLGDLAGLAHRLGVTFPRDVRIVAVEVADPLTIGGAMAPAVRRALPEVCERALCLVSRFAPPPRVDA